MRWKKRKKKKTVIILLCVICLLAGVAIWKLSERPKVNETGGEADNRISELEYSEELESKLAAEDLKQLKERLQGEFALEPVSYENRFGRKKVRWRLI